MNLKIYYSEAQNEFYRFEVHSLNASSYLTWSLAFAPCDDKPDTWCLKFAGDEGCGDETISCYLCKSGCSSKEEYLEWLKQNVVKIEIEHNTFWSKEHEDYAKFREEISEYLSDISLTLTRLPC